MTRRQTVALLILKELGIQPRLDVFRNRLEVQKAIYLAQAAGLDLGYFYGWYLRGPYCAPLAKDMFAAVEDAQGIDEVLERFELDDASCRRLERLKALVSANAPDLARKLELLASVHFLITRRQVPEPTASAVTERLRVFGKNFAVDEVEQACQDLREAGVLNGPKD